MRVATLFKRLLRLGRERVVGVELVEGDQERVVVARVGLGTRDRRRGERGRTLPPPADLGFMQQ